MPQDGADGLVSNPKPKAPKLLAVLLPLVLVVAGTAVWLRIGSDEKSEKSEVSQSTTATESEKKFRLDGEWQTAYMTSDGTQVNGIMSLTQKGDTIEGLGNDPKSAFQVTGRLARNQQGKVLIQLSKQFLSADKRPLGKPIAYFGVIDGITPGGPYFMHISGIWKFQKASKNSSPAQMGELTGKWEAALTKPR